jgi:quinol monooxygenase YgiN/quercetin dioxygenase-like cupin family protein
MLSKVDLAAFTRTHVSRRVVRPGEDIAEFVKNEQTRAWSYLFSLAPGVEVPIHRHDEERLTVVRSGKAQFTLKREIVETEAGCVIFTPAFMDHGLKVLGDQPLGLLEMVVPIAATQSITTFVICRARPEAQDELSSMLIEMGEHFAGRPGCAGYRVHRRCDQPDTFISQGRWNGTEALSAHLADPNLARFAGAAHQLLAEPAQVLVTREETPSLTHTSGQDNGDTAVWLSAGRRASHPGGRARRRGYHAEETDENGFDGTRNVTFIVFKVLPDHAQQFASQLAEVLEQIDEDPASVDRYVYRVRDDAMTGIVELGWRDRQAMIESAQLPYRRKFVESAAPLVERLIEMHTCHAQ